MIRWTPFASLAPKCLISMVGHTFNTVSFRTVETWQARFLDFQFQMRVEFNLILDRNAVRTSCGPQSLLMSWTSKVHSWWLEALRDPCRMWIRLDSSACRIAKVEVSSTVYYSTVPWRFILSFFHHLHLCLTFLHTVCFSLDSRCVFPACRNISPAEHHLNQPIPRRTTWNLPFSPPQRML